MGSVQDKKMIVGLDIGTSKVVAIVGEIGPEGDIEVVGIGSHPSKGMKKGVVVNIESTVQSIQRAVEAAGGNISRASQQLGISRNTLYRKLRRGAR